MRRAAPVVLVLCAIGRVAAGCGSASTPAASTPAASTPTASTAEASTPEASTPEAPAPCRSDRLEGTLRFGPGAGSAGHVTSTLLLRNTGSAACTLRGYPGVSFVDAHGHRLGIPAGREGPAGATVTLRPGASAGARLTIADVGVYPPAECRPTRASGLRVYPPGETAALYVPHALRVCRGDERVATTGAVVAPGRGRRP
jgi:hypothetical protein